jgi:hypothetical protein
MNDEDVSKALWNAMAVENSTNLIFEQYKIYVEMADRISARRDVANAFFLSLNGFFLSSSPIIAEKFFSNQLKWVILFPYIVTVILLYLWKRIIESYKQINRAKFRIIGVLEEKLPARPYGKTEWELLLKNGEDKNTYWPITHIEAKIPWVFFAGYTISLVIFLCYK